MINICDRVLEKKHFLRNFVNISCAYQQKEQVIPSILSHQALKSDILLQSYSLLKKKNSEREKLRNEATNIFVHAYHNVALGKHVPRLFCFFAIFREKVSTY